MPEGKKNTVPVPAPVRDEDGYSAKTHLHQPVQETATVAATALLADAPEGALPSAVRPELGKAVRGHSGQRQSLQYGDDPKGLRAGK